uniref:Carbonyl reductase 1 n=1 Tax=Periophthalmus magnuspinnatus TaxID=409849 RepID=A0A3B4BBT7_9GOBI
KSSGLRSVAVVTGSNKGIGLSIVRALCKQFEGDVYVTARDKTRGEEAVKTLASEGLKSKFHQLDINDINSIIKAAAFFKDTYGGVDVLVNNAGIAFKGKQVDLMLHQKEKKRRRRRAGLLFQGGARFKGGTCASLTAALLHSPPLSSPTPPLSSALLHSDSLPLQL